MKKELAELRKYMAAEGIDIYITKDMDDHISEYNDKHFSTMEYISGFTGGDGTLVVTGKEAGLWTDGRYFIQAAKELEGSGITLMKEGQPDCPEMEEWILEHLEENGKVGMDGRCLSYVYVQQLSRMLTEKNAQICYDKDLVGALWTEGRPEKKAEKIWILEEKWAGSSAAAKIAALKLGLKKLGARGHIISAMDEIAWLLNLRGGDVPYNPVFDSFLLLDGEKLTLYVSSAHLTEEVERYIKNLGICLVTDTERIYEDAGKIEAKVLLMDAAASSYRMVASISREKDIIFTLGPVSCMKNKKNAVERENLKKAQLKDSVAVTRFMYWFQRQLAEGKRLTECSAMEKLHAFRAMQEKFLGDSFATISAYGENAAMCHYSPDPARDVEIKPRGLYLVDSGGHYPEGTTDITRTWACGEVTEEEKKAYTLTAIANLRLADAVFPDRTSGLTLDYAVREVFWKRGIDFNHGTGHGVGYLLYVHEMPANIRSKGSSYTKYDEMTEGVYCSDEPGFYVEGKFGVRLENLVLVEKAFTNEFNSFMRFDALTSVPFDRSCIEVSLMTPEEISLYDAYHRKVFDKIAPYLPEEEKTWLAELCRPLNAG